MSKFLVNPFQPKGQVGYDTSDFEGAGTCLKLDQKTVQQDLETDVNTKFNFEHLDIDLSGLFPGLTITSPMIKGTAYSSLPGTLPFPYAVGVYDGFGIFDLSGNDEPSLLFAKTDFSNSASIAASMADNCFKFNWSVNPETDNDYSLGGQSLRWKGGWFCDDVNIEAVLGDEKITNGSDFSSGWTYTTPSWEVVGGNLTKTSDGTDTAVQTSAAMQTPLVAGELYRLNIVISSIANGITISCGGVQVGSSIYNTGSYTIDFVAITTGDLTITPTNTALRITIDSISLRKMTTSDAVISGSSKYREADWEGGNTTYVPVGVNLGTYITNALDGDTLILGSGTYYINSAISLTKKIKIVGQGTQVTQIVYFGSSGNIFEFKTGNIEMEGFGILSTTTGYLIQNRHPSDSLITGSKLTDVSLIQFNSTGGLQDITAIYCLNADLSLNGCSVVSYQAEAYKATALKIESTNALGGDGSAAYDATNTTFQAFNVASGATTCGIELYDNQTLTNATSIDLVFCNIFAYNLADETLQDAIWTHGALASANVRQCNILGNINQDDNTEVGLLATVLQGSGDPALYPAGVLVTGDLYSGNGIINKGYLVEGVTSITDDYTLDSGSIEDKIIVCDSETDITISLTEISDIGRNITIKNKGTGTVTIDAYSTDTIDGSLTLDVLRWESVTLVADTANSWIVI